VKPVTFGNQKCQSLKSFAFSETPPDVCRWFCSCWHGSHPTVIAI